MLLKLEESTYTVSALYFLHCKAISGPVHLGEGPENALGDWGVIAILKVSNLQKRAFGH